MAGYYSEQDCNLSEFKALVSETLSADDLRFTNNVSSNIPIYDAQELAAVLSNETERKALLAEWAFERSTKPLSHQALQA